MALRHLRSFIEVYRSRSISAAARNLGITQPAVSGHVSSLEAQVGRDLFVRKPRGVAPTAFADDLAAQIGDSLDRAEEAFAKAQARSSRLSGVVHIAGPAELMAEQVAPSLKTLHEAGLDLRLHLGGKDSIYQMLMRGEVDLALTASSPKDSQLASEVVGSESLIAVASPDMALRISKADNLSAALRSETMLAYDADQPLIRVWLDANGLPAEGFLPSVTAPDLRLLRALVEAGVGWSVIPDYLCREALAVGRVVRVAAPIAEPRNAFHLVWSKSALRHPRIAFARDLIFTSMKNADG